MIFMVRPESILFLLSQACRLLSPEAAREARAHGLSRAQWAILDILEQAAGLTQGDVAERLEVEPITVARILYRLAARNLIERRPDPRDRRCWRVHLTPLSTRMRSLTAERRMALGREIASGLPDPVAAALGRGLAHAVAALGTEIAPADKTEFVDA
jgi:MarR family transcriptional regulator, transcriptional regulator for hemolysin